MTLPAASTVYVPCVAVLRRYVGDSARYPGWYHNLRANPEAVVEIESERANYVARDADEDERSEIWTRAVRMYSGYERYSARAGRRIPIMVLSLAEDAGRRAA